MSVGRLWGRPNGRALEPDGAPKGDAGSRVAGYLVAAAWCALTGLALLEYRLLGATLISLSLVFGTIGLVAQEIPAEQPIRHHDDER